MTNLKKRMIDEMFRRITKGPARSDMEIKSKKTERKTIEVFHWHRHEKYCVVYHDTDNREHGIIGEFNSWLEAFNFVADYVLENNF